MADKRRTRAASLPMQPIIARGKGHRDIRFKPNLIVDFLVDKAGKLGFDLNDLHGYTFPQEDWEQFYQLMGYSVDGYHELSHVSDQSAHAASKLAKKLFPEFDVPGCREYKCEIHCGTPKVKIIPGYLRNKPKAAIQETAD